MCISMFMTWLEWDEQCKMLLFPTPSDPSDTIRYQSYPRKHTHCF